MVSFLKDLNFNPILNNTTFPYLGTKNLVFFKVQSCHFGLLMRKSPSLSCFCKRGSESERELVYIKLRSSRFGLLMRKSSSLSCFCERGSGSERELGLGSKDSVYLKLQSICFGLLMRKSLSLSCFCEKGSGIERELERELELELEREILEFMKGSEKCRDFPTKAELVEAGRMDLVDGIVRRGGWLSMGWNLEEMGEGNDKTREMVGVMGEGNEIMGDEYSSMIPQNDDYGKENGTMSEKNDIMGGVETDFDEGAETFESGDEKEKGEGNSEMSEESDMMGGVVKDFVEGVENFDEDSYCQSPTSSGRSFEMGDKGEDSGVEGILARLEKQRNLSLGANLTRQPPSRYDSDDWFFEPSEDVDGTLHGGTIAITEGSLEVIEVNGNDGHNDIRTRLQHMELELTSTLASLRSKSEKLILEEGYGTSTDMQKLSDALEFQETEIMNVKDNLRSIRAKLAVLEGKRTLAIIGARKKIDEKQRKIDSACRAIHLLRDASVVWPNSASEVFLVGSFDGWTTQRRMKKSSSGIFSVELKLYPGKYEIKFIVDGVWKTDPLRPIVKNNGYENNLFVVT